MIYADYSYYVGEFMGNVIPNESFNSAARDASAFIDNVTMGRINFDTLSDDIKAKVKNACCAVAELTYKHENDSPAVSSESVGNHSVSYAVTAKSGVEKEREKMRKVNLYLSHTGLLYRGLKY